MNEEALVSSLISIRNLVSDCLKTMGADSSRNLRSARKQISKKAPTKNALPDRVLELRDKEFFREPRTAREVHEELRSIYPCEPDRVAMALLRLKDRKTLRKASKVVDGKRQIAYVW